MGRAAGPAVLTRGGWWGVALFWVLVVLLITVPIVEITLIVLVGQQIGALPTVLLLIASALLGSWLLRREGTRTWRAFRRALSEGRPPAVEAADGVLVLLGGVLMLLPGFATDLVGLLAVLPPTRRPLRAGLLALALRRLPPAVVGDLLGPRRVRTRRPRWGRAPGGGPAAGPSGTARGGGATAAPGRVIEGEAVPGPPQDLPPRPGP